MCDLISIGMAIAGTAAGMAMSKKAPKMEPPPPPEAPPQAAQLPDEQIKRAKAASDAASGRGGYGGPQSTLLTPSGGIPTSDLLLGKTTLLGG